MGGVWCRLIVSCCDWWGLVGTTGNNDYLRLVGVNGEKWGLLLLPPLTQDGFKQVYGWFGLAGAGFKPASSVVRLAQASLDWFGWFGLVQAAL